MVRSILSEVIEDIGLSEAIKEGEKTEKVSRDEVFDILQGNEDEVEVGKVSTSKRHL